MKYVKNSFIITFNVSIFIIIYINNKPKTQNYGNLVIFKFVMFLFTTKLIPFILKIVLQLAVDEKF